jgi:phosphoribosylformimino-5-aminoimidazole carboxamide ribotide isomerase
MVTADLASGFELLAAIDLRVGRVVRLEQGDFARETTFAGDPSSVATGFVSDGITSLHVVDLDGARAGRPVQGGEIASIIDAVAGRASVEVAGGLRTIEDVGAALDRGADRVVLGTAALRSDDLVRQVVAAFGGEKIIIAVDIRDGVALGEGWRAGTAGVEPLELLGRLGAAGIGTFEVTAIDRDGLLGGPDLPLLGRLVALGRGRIIASGGIATADHLRAVRDAGCSGAIVGRALYDGRLSVRDAIGAVNPRGPAGLGRAP